MPYWEQKSSSPSRSSDHYITQPSTRVDGLEFYELEPAVILDIVLDSSHKIFQTGARIGDSPWEKDLEGKMPKPEDVDYTWIGRALIRLVSSGKKVRKERLVWAIPLESNISEYPLLNEIVIAGKYFGKYYYSRKLNYSNLVNHNVDFSKELYLGGGNNTELNSDSLYLGPVSKTTARAGSGELGVCGRYFWINKNIRALRRYEGDSVIESRFGQSIRFSSYDGDVKNNVGIYKDYNGKNNEAGISLFDNSLAGGGNPMILIRNRQRPLLKEKTSLELQSSPNPAKISGSIEEKNVGGYISENINHDGTSIHITSGQTISGWVTTCYKKMFGLGEEVSAFDGPSVFTWPILNGDQMVINTDRIVLSSRYGETFHFSKKRYGIVTDSEYTVDSHDQIVFTTHVKTVLNSPAIYLGENDQTGEPAILGQTAVNWLYELCNWLLEHTHWHHHSHVDAGKESPSQTETPVQIQKLILMRDALHNLLSRRVFVTGGGFAPGHDGESIPGGVPPVKIIVDNVRR